MQVITKRQQQAYSVNRSSCCFGEDESIATRWILGLSILPKTTIDVVVGNVQISQREVNCLAMKHTHTDIVACGSADAIITILNSVTGEIMGSLEGHTSKVTALQWSVSGLQIISCSSDCTLRVWDPVSNEQLQQIVVGCGVITSLDISPCERYIAVGGEDRTIRILSFRSLETMIVLRGHTGRVTCVRWLPLSAGGIDDEEVGLVLATGGSSDGTVRLWSPFLQTTDSNQHVLNVIPATKNRSWVISLASFARESDKKGQYLATGRADGIISIYDSSVWLIQGKGEALEALFTLQTSSSSAVNCLAWHHHDEDDESSLLLAAGHADGLIRVWQINHLNDAVAAEKDDNMRILSGGRILNELNHHKAAVNDLGWSQRLSLSALSSVSKDGSLLIYSWPTQQHYQQASTRDDSKVLQYRDIKINCEEKMLAVAAGSDAIVRLSPVDAYCNHVEGQTMSKFTAGGAVMSVAWCPTTSSTLAIGTMDGKIEVWNAMSGTKLVDTIVFDSVHIEQYTTQNDFRQLQNSSTLAFDKMVKGQQRDVMVMVLAWSFDSLYLAAGCDDGIVYVWNVSSEMLCLTHRFKGHQGAVIVLAWNADSTCLLSGSADSLGKMWQLNGNGQEFKRMQNHRSTITGLCWAPVDKYIVSCSADGSILIWDTESYQLLFGGTGNECPRLQSSVLSVVAVNSITWAKTIDDSSCDRIWAALDNGELLLYSRSKRCVILSLLGHTDRITSIVATKDGQQLLSSSSDGSFLLWTAVSHGEL